MQCIVGSNACGLAVITASNRYPFLSVGTNITKLCLFAKRHTSILSHTAFDLSNGHKYAVDQLVASLKNAEFADNCPDITELVFFEKKLAAGIDTGLEFEDEGEPIFLYFSPVIYNA